MIFRADSVVFTAMSQTISESATKCFWAVCKNMLEPRCASEVELDALCPQELLINRFIPGSAAFASDLTATGERRILEDHLRVVFDWRWNGLLN